MAFMPSAAPTSVGGVLMVVLASASLPGQDLLQDKPTGLDDVVPGARAPATTSPLCDLRLQLGLVSGLCQAELSAPGWGGVVDLDVEPSLALTPSFTMGWFGRGTLGVGFSVGAPLRMLSGQASGGDRFTVTSYGVEFSPLLAWRFREGLHGELAATFGAGFARHDVPGFSTDEGSWWSTGGRAGIFRTWPQGFQLGGELGWLAQTTMGRLQDGGAYIDITYRARGPWAGISAGYRF